MLLTLLLDPKRKQELAQMSNNVKRNCHGFPSSCHGFHGNVFKCLVLAQPPARFSFAFTCFGFSS